MKIDMQTVYFLAFWATIFFTVVGACLGLSGIWIRDFWGSNIGGKLVMTDVVLAGTSLVIAIMVRWLWMSS